ncbi:uncharacterized protein B0I36DRAFT_309822 [Microdochium trichocladiopsis]|uniref:Uncharacterized protein n=1 Tax=Microdochium trichocladiopsis TaxID=1682393 RepID=A0A9P8YDZ5_9PEZI|nr:uncharacterized protein B0I36DRAFT_309822 [Microdochium trichocladiopsis]KAH7040052.1 hypothetical protein B0I36DRAFT_309822 [Microdochium trichocladiopsis]
MATETPSSAVPPTTISLRAPSQYVSEPPASFTSPPLDWLMRTWSVTHSTLSMWRDAQNVRITYKPIQSEAPVTKIDDLVEYEKKGGSGGLKSVAGIDTMDPNHVAAWDWRGKGWLMIASSHWEVLGWGERPREGGAEGEVERWAVTWFAATLFTKEGLDIYTDRKEGLSKATVDEIMTAFKGLKESAPRVAGLVEEGMEEVLISLPWKET